MSAASNSYLPLKIRGDFNQRAWQKRSPCTGDHPKAVTGGGADEGVG